MKKELEFYVREVRKMEERTEGTENIEILCRAFLTLSTIAECKEFLTDLCTASELKEMSRRLTAAKMLRDNRVYTDIASATGLSTATISRANRCLKFGNGYLHVLDAMDRMGKRREF